MRHTYIQLDLGFVDFEFKLDGNYTVGVSYQDYEQGFWVELNAEQAEFHEEHPDATPYEVYYTQLNPEPTPYVPTLEDEKYNKVKEIEAYDISDAVNNFTVNGVNVWFDVQKRMDYFQSINSAKAVGRKEVTFFIGDVMLSIDIVQAEMMMNQLQLYANDAANVTSQHKANVNKLTDIESVKSYDYKVGYPKQLEFVVEPQQEEFVVGKGGE